MLFFNRNKIFVGIKHELSCKSTQKSLRCTFHVQREEHQCFTCIIDILLISWFLPVWLWERCPEISPTSFETQCHNIPENGRSIIYLIRSSLMYWVLTYCVEDPAQETRGTETRERRLLCVHLFSPPAGVCGQPALWKVLEVRLGSPRGTAS